MEEDRGYKNNSFLLLASQGLPRIWHGYCETFLGSYCPSLKPMLWLPGFLPPPFPSTENESVSRSLSFIYYYYLFSTLETSLETISQSWKIPQSYVDPDLRYYRLSVLIFQILPGSVNAYKAYSVQIVKRQTIEEKIWKANKLVKMEFTSLVIKEWK